MFLVWWHTSDIGIPQGDIIFAQLAWTLNDIIFAYIGNNQPISLQILRFT